MQTIEQELVHHVFFAGLDPRFVRLIAGCASNAQFDQDADIFREGEQADRFYIIRQGRVALETAAPHSGRLTIETIEAGEALGWSWLFPPYRWHFSGRALEPVRAIALDGACLRDKCEGDHDLGYAIMQRVASIIVERLHATRLQLLDLYASPMQGGKRGVR